MRRIAKATANYRDAARGAARRCDNCVMFHPVKGTCDLVKGRIRPAATCDRWARRT